MGEDLPQCRTILCCVALLSQVLHKDPLTLSAEEVPEGTLLFKKRESIQSLKLFSRSFIEKLKKHTLKRTTNLCYYLELPGHHICRQNPHWNEEPIL